MGGSAQAVRRPCGAPAARTERLNGLPTNTGEVSGLATSFQRPGVSWFIRDSGHPASVYALWFEGRTPKVREIKVSGARNKDWEDISYSVGPDGKGRLWIVESTQSGDDPFIYEIKEPDPWGAKWVPVAQRYRYTYPGGDRINTEASFAWDGDLVLVTKTNPPEVYRFDKLIPGMVNKPFPIGSLWGAKRVSVVRISPDRRSLVASDHEKMTIYRTDHEAKHISEFTNRKPSWSVVVAPDDNVEAGDFFPMGSCDLVLLSESRNTYRSMARR